MNEKDKIKLKSELMKFAEYCKKQGGSSWFNIPEIGIDNYINQIDIDNKCNNCPLTK